MEQNLVNGNDCNACRWIQTATNVFRDVARQASNVRRLTFFNGNKTATIVFQNTNFVLTYEGSDDDGARSILRAIEGMQARRELTIENVDDLDSPTFSIRAKILPGKFLRDDERHTVTTRTGNERTGKKQTSGIDGTR